MNEKLKKLQIHNDMIFDEIEKYTEKIRQLKTNLKAPCAYCIHDGFACDGCAQMKFQNFSG